MFETGIEHVDVILQIHASIEGNWYENISQWKLGTCVGGEAWSIIQVCHQLWIFVVVDLWVSKLQRIHKLANDFTPEFTIQKRQSFSICNILQCKKDAARLYNYQTNNKNDYRF